MTIVYHMSRGRKSPYIAKTTQSARWPCRDRPSAEARLTKGGVSAANADWLLSRGIVARRRRNLELQQREITIFCASWATIGKTVIRQGLDPNRRNAFHIRSGLEPVRVRRWVIASGENGMIAQTIQLRPALRSHFRGFEYFPFDGLHAFGFYF